MSHLATRVQLPLLPESALEPFNFHSPWRLLLWQLQDAVVTLDGKNNICFLNPAAEKLLAQDSEEAVGRHYTDVFPLNKQAISELTQWLAQAERTIQLKTSLLPPFGNPIAITIQAFELGAESQNTTTLLLKEVPEKSSNEETGQEIIDRLRCSLNMNEALKFAVTQLGKLISADICRLWLYEPESEEFQPLRHEYLASGKPALLSGLPPLKLPNLLEGEGRGKALYIPDTRRWSGVWETPQRLGSPEDSLQRALPLTARCLLRIPLIYEGQNYGLLQAECLEQANPWNDDDIILAQRITDATASVIHQARREELYQSGLQLRARQQEMLALLTQRAILEPYIPVFMELAAVMVSKTLGVERCRILERSNQDDGKLIAHAYVGYDSQKPEPAIERPIDSLAAYTMACNQPVIAEDMGVETRFAPEKVLGGEPIKSAAAVLIRHSKGVYGVLEAAAARRKAFRTNDVSFLQAVANVVGHVAERAQAKQKAQQAQEPYPSVASSLLASKQIESQQEKDWECLQTALKMAQSQVTQLERSNRELEQFALVASHDLQTPLRKIIVFCDYLKSSLGDNLPLESADYMVRIQKASRKMQSLISTLLVLSKINQQNKPFKPVNLGNIINEVLFNLEETKQAVQGTVSVGDTLTIDADEIQMYQVLQNLIGNALKFHKQDTPPKVWVSSHAINEQICEIVVKDNGIGFDEKNLHRIFQVYERLHGEHEYEGTGLGLAIVKKTVERHWGTISAKSTPGEGSTFTIRLPIRQRNQ